MDDLLIERVLRGSDHAFRLLVEKYRNYVYRTVYSVLRNEKDAEDAAQEVFLKIYTSLPRYEKQGFKTWITRISVHHAIDMKRKQASRREDTAVEYEESGHSPLLESTEQLVLKKEAKLLVRQRLAELPSNYKEVIIGFYLQEKSYQELAEEQQVQVKTIETKLYRARQWMKKNWKEDEFS